MHEMRIRKEIEEGKHPGGLEEEEIEQGGAAEERVDHDTTKVHKTTSSVLVPR